MRKQDSRTDSSTCRGGGCAYTRKKGKVPPQQRNETDSTTGSKKTRWCRDAKEFPRRKKGSGFTLRAKGPGDAGQYLPRKGDDLKKRYGRKSVQNLRGEKTRTMNEDCVGSSKHKGGGHAKKGK